MDAAVKKREDNVGVISLHLPLILERLCISYDDWLEQATEFMDIPQRNFVRKRRRREEAA